VPADETEQTFMAGYGRVTALASEHGADVQIPSAAR
jgi:hypothetical protein